jgi:glycosyltransferase involved in cell wall biosynthesis
MFQRVLLPKNIWAVAACVKFSDICMTVIQVPFTYFPDPVGGTEIYVAGLIRYLAMSDIQSVVVSSGPATVQYYYADCKVHRIGASNRNVDLRRQYGEGDERMAEEFSAILKKEQPDLVHFHARSPGASLAMLRQAKLLGIPVVYTYHTPTASCVKGNLLRENGQVCDGIMDGPRCVRCMLMAKGLVGAAADLLARSPQKFGALLGALGLSGRVTTALQMRTLVELYHDASRAFLMEVDHVVAVCEWVHILLLANNVERAKISICRQGISQELNKETNEATLQTSELVPFSAARPLRLVFLGRLDSVKGIDLIVDAFRLDNTLPVSLDVFAINQSEGPCEGYAKAVMSVASMDARITFRSPVLSAEILNLLEKYDVLVVPSRGLETGPLVVLEAFAAGIPVMGSRLGGIAELVAHDLNGVLVDEIESEAWLKALRVIVNDPGTLKRLRLGIRSPRHMADVAHEMVDLYRKVLNLGAR